MHAEAIDPLRNDIVCVKARHHDCDLTSAGWAAACNQNKSTAHYIKTMKHIRSVRVRGDFVYPDCSAAG